jgi:hypothetical protein
VEGGERMPVFVQWNSKIAPGQKIDLPNMLSDWMPTFLDAAGATAPQRADGISILPILTGRLKQQKDPIVYAEYFEEGHTPIILILKPKGVKEHEDKCSWFVLENIVVYATILKMHKITLRFITWLQILNKKLT